MKRSNILLSTLTATGILGVGGQSALAQTIFSDTFNNGSNAQTTPGTPTANSTTYEWFQQGGTPAAVLISPGDMHLAGRTTASSISEVQALFTATPVTLSLGQTLTFNIGFVNTQNIFPNASASTINVGLFNSFNSPPVPGVRLDASGSGTGGAVGWFGYVGRIAGTGGPNSSFITRPPQGAGITNPNQSQDALFNNASGSSTFNNPTGALIANSGGAFNAGLTGGSSYTLSYSITFSGANTLSFANNLFDSGNNLIFTQSGSVTSATNNLTYDAFAFGWRYNSASATNAIDVSSISVVESVPEPTVAALTAAGLASLFFARRFRR